MRTRLFTALLLFLLTSQAVRAQERLVIHPESNDLKKVELFVARPEGDGPFPVILFVHGHQSSPRPGGRAFTQLEGRRPGLATIDEGRLERMRTRGYLAAAVSLPGYGATPGPADFWGPKSQAAVEAALNYLTDLPDIDRGRVAVYGVSGGAATSSMVATRTGGITALILVAGLYDLGKAYPTGDDGLDDYIEREAGTTPEAFAARAALRYTEKIQAQVLILHGEDDTRGGVVDQARLLAEKLRAHGTPVRLRIYENTPHSIPIAAQWEEIDPWLREAIGR
ncbi:MAG: alpha/beta hydrolase family protein [bacterium]